MKHVLYSLFLFVFVSAYSQPNVDSLRGVWINPEQSDSNRLLAIHKIAWDGYLYSNPDTAIYFAQLEYEYAENIGYIYFMATARVTQGAASYFQSKYEKALLFFKKSQNIFKTLNDKRGVAACYNNIGGIYFEQGKYDESLFSYQKGLKIYEELADKKGIANCFNNIGMIYNKQENYHEALNYYQKSLNIKDEIGDKSGKTGSYLNIGDIYFSLKNYEQALNYNNKGLKLAEEIGNKRSIARSYNNIGNIYYEQSDYKQGLIYLKNSIKIKEELGDKKGIASSYINIGNIYFQQEKYSSAISFGKKALSIAQEVGVVYETKNASKLLYKGYNKTGDSQKALVMYELFIEMRDSIVNEENTKTLVQQQYKYEYGKKAAADSVRNTELTKVKDAQLFAQRTKLKQEEIIRYGLLGGLLVIALSLVLIIRSYKQKLVAWEQLGIKNREINKLKGQEMERVRIAKELHDGLGGSLAGIKMRLSSLAKDKNSDVDDLNELSAQVGEACREVRNISHNLMPAIITEGHITEAIGEFVDQFSTSSGLKINLNCFPKESLNELNNLVQIEIYRIVQELLNNVYKHAGATKVEIGLMMDEEGINLMVEDDGSGFDPNKSTKGIGLSNIHSRVEALGGIVKVDSQDKRGTAIHINIVSKQTG